MNIPSERCVNCDGWVNDCDCEEPEPKPHFTKRED